MTRSEMGIALAMALLMTAAGAWATTVYWTPAHDSAPDLISGHLAWGDLDADGDDDVYWISSRVY